jgi:hypothetical protein
MNGTARLHSVDHLLADPTDHLAASALVHGQEENHEPTRRHAAETAVAFQEKHLGAAPRGRRSCCDSGGTAARHHHVGLCDHGNRCCGERQLFRH